MNEKALREALAPFAAFAAANVRPCNDDGWDWNYETRVADYFTAADFGRALLANTSEAATVDSRFTLREVAEMDWLPPGRVAELRLQIEGALADLEHARSGASATRFGGAEGTLRGALILLEAAAPTAPRPRLEAT